MKNSPITLEEQVELNNLDLILGDGLIKQRISDHTLDFILSRYSELVAKLLIKYELQADLTKNPLPD